MSASESFTLRRAERRDAAVIAALATDLGYPSDDATISRRLEALMRSDGDAIFVAETGGATVTGWVHVTIARRLGSDGFAEICGLVVARDQRRRGIGRGLVARAGDWARSRSLSALRVRSNTVRSAAASFYTELGFERVKQQAVYHRRLG